MVSGRASRNVRTTMKPQSAISNREIHYLSDNFDDYWRVASKVTPTTVPTRSQSPPPPGSLHTRPPSVDPGTTPSGPDKDGASSVRSVPVRIYLPEGPVLQELAPPLLDGG